MQAKGFHDKPIPLATQNCCRCMILSSVNLWNLNWWLMLTNHFWKCSRKTKVMHQSPSIHTHLDSWFEHLKFSYLVQTLQIVRTLSCSVCPNIGRFVLSVSGHISIYLHHYFVPVILPCSNKDKIYTIQISKLNKEARKSMFGVDINSNYKLTL
jgi:hypothetical protein